MTKIAKFTADEVRAQASKHWNAFIEMAQFRCQSTQEAERDLELGMLIVNKGLSLKPGERLNLTSYLKELSRPQADMARGLMLMQAVCGFLQLMDFVFLNAEAGVVPNPVLRKLLDSSEPQLFNGVLLTTENVFLEFERRVLNGEGL
ncbi:hypothetical protein LC612_36720 [Nostoc sp. CHAB 5834]|nr:hypothetical protein [Nostoc sp. CHAB 5834]